MKNIFNISLLLLILCSCKNNATKDTDKEKNELIKLRVTSKGVKGNWIDSIVINKESLSLTKYKFSLDRKDSSSTSKKITLDQLSMVDELIKKGSDSSLIFNLCTTSREYLISDSNKVFTIQDNSCGLESTYSKLIE